MKNEVFSKVKLLLSLTKEFFFPIFFLILFFLIMNIWGHQQHSTVWAGILLFFSLTKMYLLVSHTFKKMDTLIKVNHSFNHMLISLGAIITIIVISFGIDYFCVSVIYPNAFTGINYTDPLFIRFANLLYFSVVTFTTVGYGDISPVNLFAKLITVLEMITAFVVIVFVISKYFKKD